MEPTLPDNVIVEDAPLQMVAGEAVAVPPTEGGFTVTLTDVRLLSHPFTVWLT
jgi:hypothetical protein